MKNRFLLTLMGLLMMQFTFAQDARVQIIHNSPTPGTASGPAVDLYLNGILIPELTDVEFREATSFLDVPFGVSINVGVALAGSTSANDTLVSFNLPPLPEGSVNTVIAGGVVGDPTTPFSLYINPSAQEEAADMNNVEFNVFHGSPDAPPVDVDARDVGTIVTNLAFGEFTPTYLSVAPNAYLLDVRANGSTDVVETFLADLSGLAGGAATVFASGFLGDTPGFGLFAALPDGTVVELPAYAEARVQVIHNSPEPTVDVYANGDILINDFEFRTATEFISVPAGVDIELAVAPDTSTSAASAIFSATVNLDDDETYTVIANGVVGDPDTPFELAVNAGAQEEAVDMNNIEFNVFHGSPDAPPVDVDARDVGTIVTNLAFGEFTPTYLSVAPNAYLLDVRANGSPDVVETFLADLSGLTGGAATVFASGFLGDTPGFGLFAALPDGTVVELPAYAEARVQVIHNSPEPTVDVYANGDLLIDNFEFRTATEFISVPASVDIELAVAPDTSTSAASAIFTTTVNLIEDEVYTVIAAGVVGDPDTPFDLFVNAGAREEATASNVVDVNVFHGAPDAPAVDVGFRLFELTGDLTTDLAFGEFSDEYASLPPFPFFLDIRENGNPDIIQTYLANLTSLTGQSATVFASGFLGDDPGFGLFAALADGTVVEFPANPVARVQFVHNSPEPTVDVYFNGNLAIDDFTFRTATAFDFLTAGEDIEVAIAPDTSTSAASAIYTTTVQFENAKTYTVMASGIVGDPDNPFDLFVNENAREVNDNEDLFEFNVFHGSPGAPNVDVDERFIGNLFEDVAFGEYTGYIGVDPGVYFIDIRAAGSPDIVQTFIAPLQGLDGLSGTIFASGVLGGDPGFGLFVVFPDGQVAELPAQPIAIAQVVHNSPEPTVDVYINGNLNPALDDFEFRTATGYIVLPAGQPLTLAVAPDTSTSAGSAIFSTDVTLDNGEEYMIMAGGVVGDPTTPFDLFVNPMARRVAADPGLVDFNVFHGSPDAPGVDVRARTVGNLVEDLSFSEYSDYLSVPGDIYFVDVLPTGTEDIVETYLVNLVGAEGLAFTVMASGFLGDDPSFGLFAVFPSGAVIPLPTIRVARAQIIHNSPEPTVDIYVNDQLTVDNLAFRDATPYVFLPADQTISIAVAPDTSTSSASALATFDADLMNGNTYTVMAGGVVGDPTTPFNLFVFDGARERAIMDTDVDLNLFHGAPDAPGVDVLVQGGGTLFDDVEFGNFSGYQSVAPALYNLDLTPADDNNTVLGTATAPLTDFEGASLTVFASGFFLSGDPTFQIWVAEADGNTFPLEFVVANSDIDPRIEGLNLFPNPAVSSTNMDLQLAETVEMVEMYITAANGQILQYENIGRLTGGSHNLRIALDDVPAGNYYLTLVTDKGILSKQLVVIK